jgi:hypothetical protein
MKKIIIACLLVVMAATSSFGAQAQIAGVAINFDNAGLGVTPPTGAAVGRLSASDALGWVITPDAGGTYGISYALITQHKQGTRAFGTASDGTAIFWHPETKGTGHAIPSAGNVSSFGVASWSVM